LKKILVIRFSSIGDIVLTSPILRCLKQQLNAEVHFLTKKSFASLLTHNPNVDNCYTIDKKVSEVIDKLKAERYDFVVDLHKNLRSQQVKLALGIPTASFDKLNWQKFLMVNLHINRLPDTHIVNRYFEAVKPVGVEYDGEGLDFFMPESAHYPIQDNAVVMAIGAAHATKRMPVERLIELSNLIEAPIYLIGGPSEKAAGESFQQSKNLNVENLCGMLTIDQSASVIQQAKLVITHDTGMMHIASALRKPIVSLWGNTIPEFGMYPFYPKGMDLNMSFEVQGLSCRPCSKIGHQACPKKHFKCMNEQDLGAIAKYVSEQIKSSN